MLQQKKKKIMVAAGIEPVIWRWQPST
jgi:hypothetical protein